jgi:hypothetical protein
MNRGDTVICIDNKSNGSGYIMIDVPLTIGKSYVVQLVSPFVDFIRVIDDENMFKDFRVNRFITQSEWLQRKRHNKLIKLGI